MHAAPDMAEVPDKLGEFRIDSVLGRGGSGVVYGARLGEQRIALKVLRPDQVPTGRERKRFLDEARNMQKIEHPAIVRVIDAGELDDGRPYLAMERLEGENLGHRLQRGPIPRDVALALFGQLAAAVGAMHDAGLIHRDLKPENVMLVDDDRAVLLDFGIAKPADAPPSTTTQVGMQRGTPAYMAPERFFGARASLASDIYELAVILYVMLVGGMPWTDAMNAKARLQPVPPSTYDEGFPAGLEAAIMAALSADAEDRPATAAELAASIREASAEGETAAMRPTDRQLSDAESTEDMRRSPVARNIAFIAVPLVGVAAAIAITLWATSRGGDGGERTQRDEVVAASASDEAKHEPVKREQRGREASKRAADETVAAPAGKARVAAAPPVDPAPPARPDLPDRKEPPAKAGPADEEQAAPPPKKKDPPPEKKDPPPNETAPPPTASSPVPTCRKIVALYCTPEFEATEGTMAGQLCAGMTKTLAAWEALPAQALPDQEKWCADNYDKLAGAVAERLRMYESMMSKDPPPATDP